MATSQGMGPPNHLAFIVNVTCVHKSHRTKKKWLLIGAQALIVAIPPKLSAGGIDENSHLLVSPWKRSDYILA